ncbi:MAG: helix-turn-helix domain-containing protein, partial [Firmicutes bacterium]|nr:helix-turn-helix domain-containing protein [Bacillota bacterium]
MNKTTMGQLIATKRKELGLTQQELADKMGVTDKAVSKWERDLSCPDVS